MKREASENSLAHNNHYLLKRSLTSTIESLWPRIPEQFSERGKFLVSRHHGVALRWRRA
jgi:hypothetical protein